MSKKKVNLKCLQTWIIFILLVCFNFKVSRYTIVLYCIIHFSFLEIYKGAENSLKIEYFLRAKFLCNFQNIDEKYPFGVDRCNFYIYLKDNQNGVVNFKLRNNLTNFGPETVSAFRIDGWEAKESHFAVKEYLKGISVVVTLRLRFFSIFSVTYLPSILMNVINQATNYITGLPSLISKQ